VQALFSAHPSLSDFWRGGRGRIKSRPLNSAAYARATVTRLGLNPK
jgi:hypothetical protein